MVVVGEVLSSAWAERAGVNIIGISYSLGMTLYGHEIRLAITVDQMIQHTMAGRLMRRLPLLETLRQLRRLGQLA